MITNLPATTATQRTEVEVEGSGSCPFVDMEQRETGHRGLELEMDLVQGHVVCMLRGVQLSPSSYLTSGGENAGDRGIVTNNVVPTPPQS